MTGEVVYVIAAKGYGPVKVGRTLALAARLRGLQVGNPERLRVWAVANVGPRSSKVEAEAHFLLGRSRLHGEWFNLSVTDACHALIAAARQHHFHPSAVTVVDPARFRLHERCVGRVPVGVVAAGGRA